MRKITFSKILAIGLGIAFLAGIAAVSDAASVSSVPAVGTAAAVSTGNITASQEQDSVQREIDDTLAKAEAKKAEALKQAEQAKQDALKKAAEAQKKAEEVKAAALKKAQAALEQARQILQQVQNTPAPTPPVEEQPNKPSTAVPAQITPPTISATFSQTGSVSDTVNVIVRASGVSQLELDGQRNGSLIQKYITVLDSNGSGTFTGSWDTTQSPNGSVAISAAFSFSGGHATQSLGSFTINNPIIQSPVVSVQQIIPQPAETTAAPASNVIQNAITSLQDVQQQLKTVTQAPPAASPTPTPEIKPAPAKESGQAKQSEPEPARAPAATGQLQPPQPPEITKSPAPGLEQKPPTPAPEQPAAPKPAPPEAPNTAPATPAPPSQTIPPLPSAPSVAQPTQTPPAQPPVPVQQTLPRPAAAAPEAKPPVQPVQVQQSALPPAAPVNLSSTDPRTGGISVPAVLKVEAVTLVTAPAPIPTPKPQPEPKPPAPAPNEKLVLAGRAIPNAFITLFIFSEPIVIDVRADASGRWEYTLDRQVSDGRHEVYVAITDTTGRVIVKSNPFQFIKTAQAVSVVTAAPTPANILAPDSNISARQFMIFMVLAVFGAILLGFVIIAVVAKSRQR